jgi:hypothetical protein
MVKNKLKEGQVCTLTVLSESKNPSVSKLKHIYEQNKRKAKVIFDNNNRNQIYTEGRVCLFEYPNGDFRIASLTRKYGVSVNAVIYSRESNNWVITYKHKTRAFYFIDGMRRVRVLNREILESYCPKSNILVYDYLMVKFGWLRNILESKYGNSLSFTSIVKNKLYNDREILKFMYKCSYPVAKMLSENSAPYSPHTFIKVWKELKKVLINIENLKPEFLKSPYFMDTTKMASSLGYKVNCSWGLKRLKQEHDMYSKEIVNTILEFEDISDLNIRKVYLDFAKFSGIEILTTNHQLIYEGKVMSHCVGTYSSQVNSGACAIYRYKNHTLDLRFRKPYVLRTANGFNLTQVSKRILEVNQFMGFNNVEAPDELMKEVLEIIGRFNMNISEYDIEYDESLYERVNNYDDELPF